MEIRGSFRREDLVCYDAVMKRTTISLPDEVSELLHQEARRKGASVSSIVRHYVAEGLTGSARKPRRIPWAGLFRDPEMAPGRDLEEVLEEGWADDIDRARG